MVLEGELNTPQRFFEVKPVLIDPDWAEYMKLDAAWWQERSTEYFGPYNMLLHTEFMASKRLKSPPVRSWMACVESVPRAFLSSWQGRNGMGMLEDLYTHPDFRHRGLATALIAAGVRNARSNGAGPLLIVADPDDTPKQMYERLGFRPLFLIREFLRVNNGAQA
jgi:GNAT superfamily N-acetyltransferase